MLFAINLYEHFINEKGITIASVLSLQTAGRDGSEFNAPEADGFSRHIDTSLNQKIVDISMAKVEAIVEPDNVGNDVRRETVTFISIHRLILAGYLSVPANQVDILVQSKNIRR
ncbi:MAG: hypothetical protein ACJAUG_003301 [Halioglobus sp.]|jgi:hypothetical protein